MFYNKILFIFIFIIISPNIFASDIYENFDERNKWYNANKTTLVGEMSCKITDQIIMKVKEGKPKRYTHYNNKPKIGDKLSFIYQTDGDKIKLKLMHPLQEYFSTSIAANKGDANNNVVRFKSAYHTFKNFTLRKDSLDFKYYIIIGLYSLNMERYYKNDWEGNLTSTIRDETQIITLDCRNISDKIDEIIN